MWTASPMTDICSIDRRADRKQRLRSFEQKIIIIFLSYLLQEIQNASRFCVFFSERLFHVLPIGMCDSLGWNPVIWVLEVQCLR
jgi:hypothetical protein